MANQEHLDILKQGSERWNQWRQQQPETEFFIGDFSRAFLHEVNLGGANLNYATFSNAFLEGANLDHAHLTGANFIDARLYNAKFHEASLSGAYLRSAHLAEADLSEADLSWADFGSADLQESNLRDAELWEANLRGANLRGADLTGAHLNGAILSDADLGGADLTGCHIYGVSAWNVKLQNTIQSGLIITPELPKPRRHWEGGSSRVIEVDNLEVAQFIYLLLDNSKIREVIDTVAKKAVLILGRFTPERKAVLDALRNFLRSQGYLPILFDFDKPSSQDLTETVSTLAHLSRFIIVDLSDPSSAPYEVGTIASNHIKPIQAIFHPSDAAKRVFAMFPDLITRYHWVLPPYEYQDQEHLLASLQAKVITPAERKAKELAKLRAQEFEKQ